jgi:hypothetical protein
MNYRVEFEGAALVQLNGLPSAVFDALVQRVVALVQEPWDADLMAPGNEAGQADPSRNNLRPERDGRRAHREHRGHPHRVHAQQPGPALIRRLGYWHAARRLA